MTTNHRSWFDPTVDISRRDALRLAAGCGLLGVFPVGRRGAKAADKEALPDYKRLKVLTADPLNAEPDVTQLVKSWMTPNSLFYVRSHAPVPKIDVKKFRLQVGGMVERPLSMSLAELERRFLPVQAVATLTCAGNRRSELSEIRPISGVQWNLGAIGNAEWGGLRLSDILQHAGVKPEAKYVWFEGLDEIPRGNGVIPFGGSIPLDAAMRPHNGAGAAMLATTMNGEPLPADHGYPLRSIVPGYIGARSVKWLGRITLSDWPSPNHYVQSAYKVVKEDTPEALSAAEPIDHFALNSVIAAPGAGANVTGKFVDVHGYALPSGAPGCRIQRVEVSTDGGKNWRRARLHGAASPFCWRLWNLRLPASSVSTLTVRATDSCGTMQPQDLEWNAKGYMNNAWHSVQLGEG